MSVSTVGTADVLGKQKVGCRMEAEGFLDVGSAGQCTRFAFTKNSVLRANIMTVWERTIAPTTMHVLFSAPSTSSSRFSVYGKIRSALHPLPTVLLLHERNVAGAGGRGWGWRSQHEVAFV